MSIVVVIPSRGRPTRALEAIGSIRATAALVDTSIVLAVDRDDPAYPDYRLFRFGSYGPELDVVTLEGEETGNLTRATNTVSLRIAEADPDAIIANLGDDQVARTPGWDKAVRAAMTEPGIVYGNDLFQGEALPCGGVFIHATIVRRLGWYALPVCEHLFIDNAWADIGRGIGRLTYLPDVVFEHLHPLAGKAAWDDGYRRANGQDAVDRDRMAYEQWRDHGGLDHALAQLRERAA